MVVQYRVGNYEIIYTQTTKTDSAGCTNIFVHTHTYTHIIIRIIKVKEAINLRGGT